MGITTKRWKQLRKKHDLTEEIQLIEIPQRVNKSKNR